MERFCVTLLLLLFVVCVLIPFCITSVQGSSLSAVQFCCLGVPLAWMSEGSEKEQKLTKHNKESTTGGAGRTRRLTRREIDYSNSGEGSSGTSQQQAQGAVKTEPAKQGILRSIRESSLESVWGDSASDITNTSDLWSPHTVERRTGILFEGVNQLREQLQMAKQEEMSMQGLLKLMFDMNNKQEQDRQRRDEELKEERIERERRMEEDSRIRMEKIAEDARIREEEREERAKVREEKRKEEARLREEDRAIQAAERERKMIEALREARPVVETVKIPTMEKGADIECFLELFETALTVAKIPEGKWLTRLHTALDMDTKLLVREVFTNADATYADAKLALTGQTHMSFSAASEAMMTMDDGRISKMPIRQGAQRVANYLKKACEKAPAWGDTHLYGATAIMRYYMCPELKTYLDLKGIETPDDYFRSVEEWKRTHTGKNIWDSKLKSSFEKQPFRSGGYNYRKQGECYLCRKPGHFAAECCSRAPAERPPLSRQETPPMTQQYPSKTEGLKPSRGVQRPLGEVTCFNCHQKGHISPNCTAKRKVKKVKIREDSIATLKSNEVFGSVGPHRMPITIDTGAEVTVVPAEAVDDEQLTGEEKTLRSFNNGESIGKVCMVNITVNEHVFVKQAVTQPGESLGWSVCLSLDLTDKDERNFLTEQIARRAEMDTKDAQYTLPEVRDGILVSGVLVREAKVVKKVEKKQKVDDTQEMPVPAATAEALELTEELSGTEESGENDESGITEMEGDGDEEVEVVEGTSEKDLVMEEEEGGLVGGSSVIEGSRELPVDTIREGMPRHEMAEETKQDKTLQAILKLAQMDREGYHLSQGLVFRTRLDDFGKPREQLCVPTTYRSKCMTAAHTGFGHQGRNKMIALLRPHFYWPCMARDCTEFVGSCVRCQEMDRTSPKPSLMTERQVVSRPFTDVAIDIVGPFPTARGGFKFMLTCIDSASRWPEAIAIRSTTTRVMISCLTSIFTRWGFPEKITSDNGPQFTSKGFLRWLKEKGIAHSRSTPYHPQGNGVVERLHRTLNTVVGKIATSKGNWAEALPMALFFLRCTPSASTGLSPFLVTHGWEPTNPIQLLYQSWVKTDLGWVDLTDWILQNTEDLETARDKATCALIESSSKRTISYNKKARDRSFKVGDLVWIRRPGLDHKLWESWVGPGKVVKQNSPVSYKIQTDERLIPTVNVQQLKIATQESVRKITAVVEDTNNDNLTKSFASANVKGQTLTSHQNLQLQETLAAHDAILTKQPGLTNLTTFEIDTGSAKPIQQRPYSTPVMMKPKVDEEITWLLEQGFIVPSNSPWASPIVTVRKPDGSARLCVDFRKVNALTVQTPFFMPRVEEVIEGIGRATYISKLDLSKGFYQVALTEQAQLKTAFICHRGAFHFTRMPFGVKNAPACFQALMQKVLVGLDEFATAYMDDVVIFSSTWEDHVVHIGEVLGAIGKAGLTVNPKKCCWGGSAVEFLGHFVGKGVMSIPAHRTSALEQYSRPTTKRGLRAFLGSVGFYRRYLNKLADWTSILTPLTSKKAPQVVDWTDERVSAFRAICEFFCSPPNLCVPIPCDMLSIVCDASGKGVGGVLQVKREGEWLPSACYSRQLRGPEHRYSATELEALALVETVKHFAYHLYGRSFVAYTDHRPLEQLMSSTRLNPRLARLAYKLQHWLVEVRYLPGVDNTMADALSREERGPLQTQGRPDEEDSSVPESRLAAGDVEATPPQDIETED